MDPEGLHKDDHNEILQENLLRGDLFQLVFESDPGGISVVTGPDMIFQLVNPAYHRLIPHPEVDPLGKPYREIWPPEEGFQSYQILERVMETGEPVHMDHYERDFPDGSKHFFVYHVHRINWHNQPAVLSILWEITDRELARRAAEESALLAQASAARSAQLYRELERLLFIVSHDLQEPVRKIQAFGDRLNTRYRSFLPKEGLDDFDRMQKSAQRAQRMLLDILQYAKVSADQLQFSQIDLNWVAGDILSELNDSSPYQSAAIKVSQLPAIEANLSQMKLLFRQMIDNALKFSRPEQTPQVEITSDSPSPDFIQLYFIDHGIGFNEQFSDLIFLPFQRLNRSRDPSSTGMGLAICKKIVERHGGSITVKSQEGQGSTFTIALPVRQA